MLSVLKTLSRWMSSCFQRETDAAGVGVGVGVSFTPTSLNDLRMFTKRYGKRDVSHIGGQWTPFQTGSGFTVVTSTFENHVINIMQHIGKFGDNKSKHYTVLWAKTLSTLTNRLIYS